MKTREYRSNFLLLLAAAIWGFAFAAQRAGGKFIGPFMFNGLRFALGSLSLVPLILFFGRKPKNAEDKLRNRNGVTKPGLIAGIFLFFAASLQQMGLMETSAGKAAFITGLYIVIVPIAGIFLRQYIKLNNWLGAAMAVIGLYLLSITGEFSISRGDLYELIGAFFWAAHIHLIDYYSHKVNALKLSSVQFAVCALLSLITAAFFEAATINGILHAIIPILYGGICSVGIGYTLQVIGQKNAQPSHAAIILSMEAVFGAVGGCLILHESLNIQEIIGCMFMLAGMLLTQLPPFKSENSIIQ